MQASAARVNGNTHDGLNPMKRRSHASTVVQNDRKGVPQQFPNLGTVLPTSAKGEVNQSRVSLSKNQRYEAGVTSDSF